MSLIVNTFLNMSVALIQIYIWIIIISALMSLVNPDPYNQIVQAIRKLTEPAFSFVRKKMPFVVVSGIDLSPIVIIFALNLLISILYSLRIY